MFIHLYSYALRAKQSFWIPSRTHIAYWFENYVCYLITMKLLPLTAIVSQRYNVNITGIFKIHNLFSLLAE